MTLSKDNELAGPFVDDVDIFYGWGNTPIGVVRNGKTPEHSRYLTAPFEPATTTNRDFLTI